MDVLEEVFKVFFFNISYGMEKTKQKYYFKIKSNWTKNNLRTSFVVRLLVFKEIKKKGLYGNYMINSEALCS